MPEMCYKQSKAVLYARVSSDRQEREGFSIPAQIKLLHDYSIKYGMKIAAEFVEAETAKKSGRKQFNEMIKFLKKNKSVRTILVEKTDRLYRNLKDYILLDDFEGLEIHFVKEATILSEKSRSQDKFMHGIRVLMAKNYIDNLSEEIKKGLKEKAEQGFCPTKAPFGYKNIIRKDGKRIIVPDVQTAPFVRKAFELYATGVYSYDKIAKILASEGFCPNNKPCTKRVVELILHNHFYIGTFSYMGKRYENGVHEKIVSDSLFQAVQNRLSEGFISRVQKNNFDFLGLFKCSHCGCAITAEIKKNKYIYYHCTGRRGGTCKRNFIRQEKIETAVLDFLKRLHLTDEEIENTKTVLKEMLKFKSEFTETSAENLEKQIKRLRNRLDNLYIDKTDGIISDDFYFEKRNLWEQELDNALAKYQIVNTHDRTFIDNASLLLELAKNAHSLYLNADEEKRIRILKTLCSNFFFDGESIILEAFPPFDVVINREKLKIMESMSRSQNFYEAIFSALESTENVILFERIKLLDLSA